MSKTQKLKHLDNNTRSYPRTTREAFGAYADRGSIEPMEDDYPPMDWQDVVVYIGCVAVLVAVVLFLAWGWVSL